MDAPSQSNQVIQSLRPGDLVGHRQQPERQYEVLTVDEQRTERSGNQGLVISAVSPELRCHLQAVWLSNLSR